MVAHQREEKQYTADDLWELSHRGDERRYELDEGKLVEMSPTGDSHGIVTNWFAFLITGHVDTHDLGEVTAAETGFVLSTKPRHIVRAPDIGFISKARQKPLTGKYYPIALTWPLRSYRPTIKRSRFAARFASSCAREHA